MTIDALGFVGGILLVIGFIPQVYVVFKKRKVDDVSLIFIIFQILTCIILMTYTTIIGAIPLFIANTGILFQLLLLLYAKLSFDTNYKADKETQTEYLFGKVKVSCI